MSDRLEPHGWSGARKFQKNQEQEASHLSHPEGSGEGACGLGGEGETEEKCGPRTNNNRRWSWRQGFQH